MKTLLLLFLFPAFTYAQSWAPIGAKWTFSQWLYSTYESYATYESIADTTLFGRNCKVIREINPQTTTSKDTFWHFMYSDSGRVYFLRDSDWCKLMDYNLLAGDSFIIDCIPLVAKILSVDTIMINGHSRRIFNYSASHIAVEFSGSVIEGIGNIITMFPQYDNSRSPTFLRCYEDTIIGHYKNQNYAGQPWTDDCERIFTAINDVPSSDLRVYPNPVENFLHIDSPSHYCQLQVINTSGEILVNMDCPSSGSLDLSKFADGIYQVKLMDKHHEVKAARVLKISR